MTKRDEAVDVLCEILAMPYRTTQLATLVGLIVDAAKEEIRAEDEDRRWHEMEFAITMGPPYPPGLWDEWRALKAKREASGKNIDE